MATGPAARALVCMRCGSDQVRHQTSAEGLWPGGGEGVAWVCDACHHIGAPFVLEDAAAAARDADLWQAELEDAAFAVDEGAWRDTPERTRRPVLGLVLAVLAALFLLPALYALLRGAVAGSIFFVLWGLVGTGWLIAIGSALGVVGLRMLRPVPSSPADDETGRQGSTGGGPHEPDDAVPAPARLAD